MNGGQQRALRRLRGQRDRTGFVGTQRDRRPELRYKPDCGIAQPAGRSLWMPAGVRNYLLAAMHTLPRRTRRQQQARAARRSAVQAVPWRRTHCGLPIRPKAPLEPYLGTPYVRQMPPGGRGFIRDAVIHEPAPMNAATLVTFPNWQAFWIMIGIAALTFALFLPHTALWGLVGTAQSPGQGGFAMRIRRFTTAQRAFSAVLLVTFLLRQSSSTGLIPRDILRANAGSTARRTGTRAVLYIWGAEKQALVLFALHLAYLAGGADLETRNTGPDSLPLYRT